MFGRSKFKPFYAISLDIGTEYIKTLLFKVNKEFRGEVVGVGRVRQGLGDMQSGAVTDIGGVVENCEKAILQAQAMAKRKARQVIVGIAGELVKGTTTTVHYKRSNSHKKIDDEELEKIISQVQNDSFEFVRKKLASETGIDEIDIKLVNAAIVDVKIDGFKVTNPLGFQGKEVSIDVFNAYAPLVHLGALQTVVDELGLDLLTIASEPYAVARSVSLESLPDLSSIFIDIGGGTTDIAVLRNGGLEGTKMIAIGGRSFTKRIMNELKTDFLTAESLKIKYSQGELTDQKQVAKISNLVAQDVNVWLSGVELALSDFSDDEFLPSKILLCGGGSALPEIKKVLNSEWWQGLPFAKKPEVKFIQVSEVANIEDKTGALRNPQDITPMGLANVAIDLAGEQNLSNKILQGFVKLVKN
jgi:cell division protein FtsA